MEISDHRRLLTHLDPSSDPCRTNRSRGSMELWMAWPLFTSPIPALTLPCRTPLPSWGPTRPVKEGLFSREFHHHPPKRLHGTGMYYVYIYIYFDPFSINPPNVYNSSSRVWVTSGLGAFPPHLTSLGFGSPRLGEVLEVGEAQEGPLPAVVPGSVGLPSSLFRPVRREAPGRSARRRLRCLGRFLDAPSA